MRENNDILIELLTEMRIKFVFEKNDYYIKIKASDLCNLFIKLLKLESSVY